MHVEALSGVEHISLSGGETAPPTDRRDVPRRLRARDRRKLEAAGRVLAIGFVCFALWLLLDVHSLQRSAQSSPLGARRSAALTVLRPIGWIGDVTGVADLGDLVKDALGRPTGGPVVKSTSPVPLAAPRARQPAPASAAPAPHATAPTLPPLPHPTAANPLRVLVVGDSIGEDFGQSLVAKLAATGVVQATLDGRIDTGLARPDYFDWPGELQTDVSRFHPDVVVAMMGANDNHSFLVGDREVEFGTPEWVSVYRQRVATMMNEATAQGERMMWVGMPVMPSSGFSDQMQVLNRIVESQAVTHPGVSYLDSWHLFVNSTGGYAAYLPNASGGQQQVREPDGVHLARPGSDRLADWAIGSIQSDFGVRLGS
ncbi:MAG TPA: DUF459 domain-containing protein [Acidimicrobiales bacterium]|nr:DUF459 domain-containing protein [Acidimicrobiales bacterium]